MLEILFKKPPKLGQSSFSYLF